MTSVFLGGVPRAVSKFTLEKLIEEAPDERIDQFYDFVFDFFFLWTFKIDALFDIKWVKIV
jgi:hypothetical protein